MQKEAVHTGFYFTDTRHRDTYPAIDPSKRDFSGRYVFVTGASKGIGRETVLAYARAGAAGIGFGARSEVTGLVEALEEMARVTGKTAPKLVPVRMDVTDEASVAAAAAAVAAAFPRLDVLVNNAGYAEYRKPIGESDPAEWWKTWQVNVLGPYLVTRAFLPLLKKDSQSSRTVINISSIGAHWVAPGASAYQISKLAVLRLTEFLDVDHGAASGDGVLTYAVHPGGVPTELSLRLPAQRQLALTETPQVCAHMLVALTEKRIEWLAGRYVSATWDFDELLTKEDEVVKGDKLKMRMVL